mgnify:CR=1 FL=1|tara:strand:+ start:594 stop:848 length:255 start_codon:yes stop_codon:yes gene_type:complete
MLKLKDSKKEFSIVYQSEDMSENTSYDYLLTEKEADLLMDNGDVFVLDSNTDIEEWEDMSGIYEESEFKELSEDFGMSNYFKFV